MNQIYQAAPKLVMLEKKMTINCIKQLTSGLLRDSATRNGLLEKQYRRHELQEEERLRELTRLGGVGESIACASRESKNAYVLLEVLGTGYGRIFLKIKIFINNF